MAPVSLTPPLTKQKRCNIGKQRKGRHGMVAIYHTFSPCSDPLLSYSCNQHSSLIIATKVEMCQKTCLLSQLCHQVQAVLTLKKWVLRCFRMFTLCQSTRRQRKYTSDVLGTTTNIPDTFSLRHWFQHSVTGCASSSGKYA